MCQEVLGGRNTAGDSPCLSRVFCPGGKVDLNRYVHGMICFKITFCLPAGSAYQGNTQKPSDWKQTPKTFLFLICSKKTPASYSFPEFQRANPNSY